MPRWNSAALFRSGNARRWLQRVERDFQDDVNVVTSPSLVLQGIDLLCDGEAAEFIDGSSALQAIMERARQNVATPADLNAFVQLFEEAFPSGVQRTVVRSVGEVEEAEPDLRRAVVEPAAPFNEKSEGTIIGIGSSSSKPLDFHIERAPVRYRRYSLEDLLTLRIYAVSMDRELLNRPMTANMDRKLKRAEKGTCNIF